MDELTKLETILQRTDEDATAFAARAQRHVDARRSDGWNLQTRQDEGASITFVFTRMPVD